MTDRPRPRFWGLAKAFFPLLLAAAAWPLPDTVWTRTYGGPDEEDCRQAIRYLDGYAIAGRTRSYGAGNVDVYVIRVDLSGDTLWTRTFGTPFNDGAAALCLSPDSCLLVSYTSAFNTGNPDGHLVKIDPGGGVIWAKTYGGLTGEAVYSVDTAPVSGCILCGAGGGDAFLLRTDANGDTAWIRRYGGAGSDIGYAVRACGNGGYVFCGATDSYGAGASDAWLVRTDSLGNLAWSKTYGAAFDDIAWQIAADDSGFSLVGETWSYGAGAPGYADLYLIRTGPGGDTLWTRNFGGPFGDGGFSITNAAGSRTLASGYTESGGFGAADLWLLEIGPSGDTLSSRVYGGPADDRADWIMPAPDSGYAVFGSTGSFGSGGKDIWFLKTGRDTMLVAEQIRGRPLGLSASPNPFRRVTRIDAGIRTATQFGGEGLGISIYDIAGKCVKVFSLPTSHFPLPTSILWDGTSRSGHAVPAGVYFLVGQSEGVRETVKIIFLGGSR